MSDFRVINQSHLKGLRVYQCSHCGFRGVWGDTWEWYGSLRDMDGGRPLIYSCSQACRDQLWKSGKVPRP